jgi:hypothetical protein
MFRGMGEKFAANPVTGTGSMTAPIATSPGRSGFGPRLDHFRLDPDSGRRASSSRLKNAATNKTLHLYAQDPSHLRARV